MTHLGLRKPAARRGIEFQQWRVEEIDPDARRIRGDGRALGYDHLVIATGAGMRPSEVPGLTEYAQTIWGFEDSLRLAKAVKEMLARAERGEQQQVLFNVAAGNKCAGPLYEMVFMLETYLRRKKLRDRFDITWTTSEDAYIQAFGPKLHEATTKEFAKRGIEAHHGNILKQVEPHLARFADGTSMDFDWMIGFPPYVANTRFEGLPSDERGFIHANPQTWQVRGLDDVYVVGDGGDFPVKQAFLALGMAGVVAHNIANEVKGKAPKECFDPVSMCIMEQLDTGLYAQVPLELTGDAAHPVRVRPNRQHDYVVRDSRLWQMGKWGMYMTMVLQMGRMHTFHEGPLWSTMDLMIKGMQKVTPA
jgi:NADH dehydrogenase FAD-containing subunit